MHVLYVELGAGVDVGYIEFRDVLDVTYIGID